MVEVSSTSVDEYWVIETVDVCGMLQITYWKGGLVIHRLQVNVILSGHFDVITCPCINFVDCHRNMADGKLATNLVVCSKSPDRCLRWRSQGHYGDETSFCGNDIPYLDKCQLNFQKQFTRWISRELQKLANSVFVVTWCMAGQAQCNLLCNTSCKCLQRYPLIMKILVHTRFGS